MFNFVSLNKDISYSFILIILKEIDKLFLKTKFRLQLSPISSIFMLNLTHEAEQGQSYHNFLS